MRLRMIRSTLAIALIAVLALGVPLTLLARHEVWSSGRDQLMQQATSIAASLEEDLDARRPISLTGFTKTLHGQRVIVTSADGSALYSGPPLRGRVLRATVQVASSTVTLEGSRRPTARRATELTLLILGLMAAAVVGAVALALRQAKRLSAPLSALTQRAEGLGRGEFAAAPIRSGIPEIDRISGVLDTSARQLEALIELQRDFASDAAHQLRTPLTGIGLRLEELTRLGGSDVTAEAEDALVQVDRLDAVITSLLARARGDADEPTTLDVSEIVKAEATNWERALHADGRQLTLRLTPGTIVRARAAHLVGILSCLLENAVRHGEGEVQVAVTQDSGDARVTVLDQGHVISPELGAKMFDRRFSGSSGTGIGLALARSLALSEDGTLDWNPEPTTTFVLTIPSR